MPYGRDEKMITFFTKQYVLSVELTEVLLYASLPRGLRDSDARAGED